MLSWWHIIYLPGIVYFYYIVVVGDINTGWMVCFTVHVRRPGDNVSLVSIVSIVDRIDRVDNPSAVAVRCVPHVFRVCLCVAVQIDKRLAQGQIAGEATGSSAQRAPR